MRFQHFPTGATMEKYEHPKYSKEDIDWQKSVVDWFGKKGISIAENDEYFIYTITHKDGEKIKVFTPKRKKMGLTKEGDHREVEVKDLIAAQIEFAPEYIKENYSLIEVYDRYARKFNIENKEKKKKK